MTQQIKTLRQNALHKPEMIKEHDTEINALLADGWQILDLTTYIDVNCDERIVTLVRDVKSAPDSTRKPAYKFNIGDTVTLIKPSESRKFEESRRDHTGEIHAQLPGIDANQYVVDFSQDEYNDALVLEEWQLELFWRRGE